MTILSQATRSARRENATALPVIALHCSGADGRQWRSLADSLGSDFRLTAPAFYGCAGAPSWNGAHAFTLADEARPILSTLDSMASPAHLIGHSYGGGVALHIARVHPRSVASLTLYEPSAFHLLRTGGPALAAQLAEIRRVAATCAEGVASGNYRAAARHFVDYWGGAGAWQALRPTLRDALTAWLPKAPLDFHALIEEPARIESYRALTCPVLLLRGEFAPAPTAAIVDLLADALPDCRLERVSGAGHMGPISHDAEVNSRIVNVLRSLTRRPESRPPAGRSAAPIATAIA